MQSASARVQGSYFHIKIKVERSVFHKQSCTSGFVRPETLSKEWMVKVVMVVSGWGAGGGRGLLKQEQQCANTLQVCKADLVYPDHLKRRPVGLAE